jgi:hypothetical protein
MWKSDIRWICTMRWDANLQSKGLLLNDPLDGAPPHAGGALQKPATLLEDSLAGPDLTLSAVSCVSKSNSCKHCSVHSVVQQGRTKLDWGNLSVGAPAGHCFLGCKTVMCSNCVDMCKPVLENVFNHDTDDAVLENVFNHDTDDAVTQRCR